MVVVKCPTMVRQFPNLHWLLLHQHYQAKAKNLMTIEPHPVDSSLTPQVVTALVNSIAYILVTFCGL